jgi:hypothetical protein
MAKVTIARWTDWNGNGSEHLALKEEADSIVAEGVVIGPTDHPYAARYRIACDSMWRCRQVEIDLIGDDGHLRLSSDGEGRWDDSTNQQIDLNGAIDIDLSFSPFTNTLPIRRLRLRPGQSAEIKAVYIRVPEMSMTIDPQRYTCLDSGRYRYESLDSDFTREIEVDGNGLVLTYPGLFRRVL